MYDEVGGSAFTKHRWIEIHRDGKLLCAFGLYPDTKDIPIDSIGKIVLPDSHSPDINKEVVFAFNTTKRDEAYIMARVLELIDSINSGIDIDYSYPTAQCRTFANSFVDIYIRRDMNLSEYTPPTPIPILHPSKENNQDTLMRPIMEKFINDNRSARNDILMKTSIRVVFPEKIYSITEDTYFPTP